MINEKAAIDARGVALLQTATELFLTNGYAGVSVDAIIARVGGSKRDLYQRFDGKEGLLRRVIDSVCREVLEPLRTLPATVASLEESLVSFAQAFVACVLSPRVIALQRLVIGESYRFPEFVEIFLRQGPAIAHAVVVKLIERQVQAVDVDNTRLQALAALFCDMLATGFQHEAMANHPVLQTEIDTRIKICVSMLMREVGCRTEMPIRIG